MLWIRRCAVLFVVLFCVNANAGSFQDSLFRTFSSVSGLINQDSLRLSIRQWVLSRIEIVTRPTNKNSRMRAPDVTGYGDGRFSFFWSDSLRTNHIFDTVYRREIRITSGGVDTSAPAISISYSAKPPVNYLHADKGQTAFLASFIDSNLTTLKAYSDPPEIGLNRVGAGAGNTTRASQCYWRSDTFLVVFQKDDQHILMRRLYFNGISVAQLAKEDNVAVAVDLSAQQSISNASIAADEGGRFIVQWLLGTSGVTKTLRCMVYDANRVKTDSVSFTTPVDSIGMLNLYDESPAVAYGTGTFGSVYWDPKGIVFRSIRIGPPMTFDTIRINTLSTSRYPTVAANGRYIVVAWMTDSLNSTRIQVSGIRDTIMAGYLPFSSALHQYRFSDAWIPSTKIPGKTTNAFALNCAMDSIGSIAATWPIDSFVNARMWANRGVRIDSGTWDSKSTRFMDNSSDSAYMLPASFLIGDEDYQPPNTDSVKAFVRVGLDSADETAWRPWTIATDSAALVANTMGGYRFFKYKVVLYRGRDTLGTPVVRKGGFRWNAKPSFLPLDSVFVNGKKSPGMNFNSIDTVFSRSDTVELRFTLRDADDSDTLFTRVSGYRAIVDSLDTLYPASGRSTRIRCLPNAKSDTTINLAFAAADKKAWSASGQGFTIRTRNSRPQLHAYALLDTNHTGVMDTVEVLLTKSFNLPQTDSITFLYSCRDTNDFLPQYQAFGILNTAKVDSTQQGINRPYKFKAAIGRASGDTLVFSFADPETTITRTVYIRVNHFPVISSLSMGSNVIHNGDTISTGIGALVSFQVNAKDTDVTFWDHLSYRYTRASKDSLATTASFSFPAARTDSSLLVRVTDSFGKVDSLRFFMKSQWLATDTTANKAYQQAKNSLRDSNAIIIGSGVIDSISIPLVNTGNDTLRMTGLRFKGGTSGWIKVRVPGQAGNGMFDSLVGGQIDTVSIGPQTSRTIMVFLDASRLFGDAIMHDTIILATNDFSHQFDTIPVNLEYNDLPRIFSITLDFPKDKPYWLAKKSGSKAAKYTFPPHAKISVRFSEPMDTASAGNAFSAYSVFDKRVSNPPPPISLDRTWAALDSVLTLTPRYTAASPYFNGFQPTPGFFIPGDSIRLIISSAVTDNAVTPHGPNGLDVHKNSIRAVNADTTIPFRVDSITYDIVSVSPANRDTGVSASTYISLTFSGPPLPTTVDMSKTNNRSLIVRSAYFRNAPVSFNSISLTGSTVTFVPAKQFFYGDTVTCYYRARWVRDSLGYPVDVSGNGIPMSMFDTLSNEDDKQWSFTVNDMVHTGFTPLAGANGVSPSTAITVRFSDSIPASSVDTSKTGNKQLIVSTAFSRGAPVAFDSVRTQRNGVAYYPGRRFFYGDTVFCSYEGLMTKDSARYSIDLAGRQLLSTNDKAQWRFAVKNISLVLSRPDSASQGSIHPVIALTFSDPVYAGTFDTDTSAKNRSFSLTSTFISDSALSFRSIVFSQDSTQVSLRPKAVFFSNDSIHCFFRGFAKAFRYDSIVNLPSDSLACMAGHDWYFYTENTGFYTYPNPYKPGKDPRHCGNPATDPCGIWFTNLHLLRRDVSDVIVKIFGMNANPVYNSQSAGAAIHFTQNDPTLKPQWKWDTRNQRGEFVASGLYFYLVTDLKGSVLTKGKLMIVR